MDKRGSGLYGFHAKLGHCLNYMALGLELKLKSGHTLVIPEGCEEPGLLMTHVLPDESQDHDVYMIGEETAWMMLIDHAKKMTHTEMLQMIQDKAEVNVLRRRNG